MSESGKPGFKRVLVGIGLCVAGVVVAAQFEGSGGTTPTAVAAAETYRLVHAFGNEEHVSGRGLSKSECETRKKELKAVATAVGSYNEATGYGSITCLPESLFND